MWWRVESTPFVHVARIAVIVTDEPMLKRMTMAQQEFYLRQENGIELMQGVKNLSVGPGAVSQNQVSYDNRESCGSVLLCTRVIWEPWVVITKMCGENSTCGDLPSEGSVCFPTPKRFRHSIPVVGVLLGTTTITCHDHLHTH